ncbi:hypothetical protein F7725_005340 [Dissostichus mawsoni]|uniref:DDE Tnp4 domain-containing protein n=1 Tax=Dissostichus mawsoni TaxID=36200 RepID=A0A7J5YRB0_DISMA|nr:hypothetical protein F7725_005340 [Dissostichus mawsoni]
MAMFDRRMAEDDERYHALKTAMICEYYGTRRIPHSLWVNNRTSAWWETVVPTYTDVQWIKDFRMSKHSFQYLCSRLEATLGRRDTNYRECVPVRKKIDIALWKLATNSEYRTISHLFGVGISTVCCCVHDLHPAFGRLKGRWRCLMKRNDCRIDKIRTQVAACCVLHNLCESNGDEYREEWTALPATQLDDAPAIGEAGGQDTGTALMRHLNSV